jgi:hypothetical protein
VINIRQNLRFRKRRQTCITFFAFAFFVRLFAILFTERSSVTVLLALVTKPAILGVMRTVFTVVVVTKGGLLVGVVELGRGRALVVVGVIVDATVRSLEGIVRSFHSAEGGEDIADRVQLDLGERGTSLLNGVLD